MRNTPPGGDTSPRVKKENHLLELARYIALKSSEGIESYSYPLPHEARQPSMAVELEQPLHIAPTSPLAIFPEKNKKLVIFIF